MCITVCFFKIQPCPITFAKIWKLDNILLGMATGKQVFSYIVGGNEKWYNSYRGKLSNINKTRCAFILYPTIWLLGIYPYIFPTTWKYKYTGYSYTNINVCICNIILICHKYTKHKYHKVVLFLITNHWKPPQCSDIGNKKLCYSHTMEHNATVKKYEEDL